MSGSLRVYYAFRETWSIEVIMIHNRQGIIERNEI